MPKQTFSEPAALHPSGPEIQHPFLRARQEWDERTGSLVKRIANLQRMNGVLTLAVLLLAGGLVYMAKTVKVLPYVVEVSQTGEVRGVGLLPQPWQGQSPAPIRYAVQQWLEWMRVLPDSQVVLGQQWAHARAFMTNKVIAIATGHMKEQLDKQQKGMTAQIQVTSLLPVTPDWKVIEVEWTEKTFSQQGVTTATEDWKAIVHAGIYTPTEVKDPTALRNPLGVFVTDYHWQKKPGKDGR